ncbi:MAG: histidinol-phosphate transaminase [Candidatus Diapherotrites archaeon]|nr:histidinol-phosphate transaminase [Candidatus Diapherotrites archaeon]
MIQPKKAVIKMKDYSPPTAGRAKKLRLDFNENTIGCSPKVIDALKKITSNNLAVYPEYGLFKKILKEYVGVSEEEIFISNGSDDGIKTIIDTFMEKGEEIIIPSPTFAMFKFYASIVEAKITEILYNEDLSFPTKKVLELINKNTKIVVMVNPNNPTGTSIRKEDIIKITKKAQENEAIVLIDEAYFEFYGESCIDLIFEYDNVFVTRTFSKAFGLAGLRLGYTISNKTNISALAKEGSPYGVNTLALIAGEAALSDVEFVKNYANEILENKKYVEKELESMGLDTFPTSANFILTKFGNKCDKVANSLKEKGILVRNRTKDPLLNGCIRITIGTKEQCEQLLEELKLILSKK